jgi:lipopolysaccharide biosynthesis protein
MDLRFISGQQRRLDVRIANLHFHSLAMLFPRLHTVVFRAIKLAWWGITFQLLAKYRERRACLRTDSKDHALTLPFPWAPSAAEAAPSMAVICHLFFDDMAEEFRRYLSNIPFPFDLWITTDTDEKKRHIENIFFGWNRGNVEVRVSQNRGRDIAPKLITCADVYGKYEHVLHIHGKCSPYGGRSTAWRRYLLDTLIGSPDIVRSVFEVFRHLPNVGMIAPQHLDWLRPSIGWGINYEEAETFSRRFALDLDFQRSIDFPAGSMFWARSAALQPLLGAGLSFDDFATEEGQIDGTLAHVIERLYFRVCESAGYDWIKIVKSDPYSTSRSAINVSTPEELRTLIVDRCHS